jgi:hypothetical protein
MRRKFKFMTNTLLTAIFAAAVITSCEDSSDPVQATGVTLNRTTLSLIVGDSETLTATVAPDDATDKTVTWSSNATAVATVADGTVTAVAAGSATITVTTANGKTATCAVTVAAATVAATGVSLDMTTLSLVVGDSKTLTATVEPDDATDKTVTWSSNAQSVATVTNGVVTAVAAGSATITATTANGKTATCAVTVAPAMDELFTLVKNKYQQVCEAYLQIDNQYSTLAERQGITPSSSFLYNFWQKSYDAIYSANLLVQKVNGYGDRDIPEADKNLYRGTAYAYSTTVLFYLKTLFGGVPLVTAPEETLIINELPRTSEQQMNDFIRAELEYAVAYLSGQPSRDSIRFTLSLHVLQTGDAALAKSHLTEIINGSHFVDINGDAIINDNERQANMMLVQAYLLRAEAALATGNNNEAAQMVSVLYQRLNTGEQLQPSATAEEIRTAVRNIFSNWNTGMKFLNTDRWGLTANWGGRALLPIPQQVMEANPNLTQNPGW